MARIKIHENSNSDSDSHSRVVVKDSRRGQWAVNYRNPNTNNDNSARHITLATKVRRKLTHPDPPAAAPARFRQRSPDRYTARLSQLLWLLCCLTLAHNSMADCPSLCECKWKSGKESVLCLNANLTHIPAHLDPGTQVLDLTGNEIAAIPHDTFAAANLLNLQKVYLAKCRLKVIERYAFRKLINLVELDLSYNQLSAIPTAAFEFVPELRELKLNGNPIVRVANEAFLRVPQLVRLELSDCRLNVVEVQAFAGLESSLEWLKLDGNRLSEIRSGTITSLTNLHGIELARNQWNCSCSLRPLRAWMLRQNIPCGIPPLCRAPPRLAGKTWDKIDLDDFACVPQIIATDTTAHGVEGRNVTMSCYVEGVPEPSVRWMVKNRVIANLSASGGEPSASPRTAAATQGRKTYVVNMLRNASNLTILTADMQDAGIYTCAAENKAGKVEASVTLAVSRRPPEAPLGVRIVLLCVLIALLFVVGSSFVAICFCSLRRKRKMRLWNSVPPARTESYEKIEMTTRSGGGGGSNGNAGGGGVPGMGNCKSDLRGNGGSGANSGSGSGGGGGGGGGIFRNDENGYLCSATTPLDCGSDDGGNTGVAIVNPSGGSSSKRNGDYCNVPTHCDDDDELSLGWKSSQSPQNARRRESSSGSGTRKGSAANGTSEEKDLHIPRLIDFGPPPDSVTSSISSQVDAATRLAGVYSSHIPSWTTTPIATTKIDSPHSKPRGTDYKQPPLPPSGKNKSIYGGNEDISSSVFSSSDHVGERDLFDGNYPDLLDIAKYAVAQANSQANAASHGFTSAGVGVSAALGGGATTGPLVKGGLSTLPRKLKNTGKYFKNSSDSQSPLLADNSSKYGSSTLGDASFLNELTLGRRFSAESSYSNYSSSATYTSGQRSNSFLNLVHSSTKTGLGGMGGGANVAGSTVGRRVPSLPASPVHELPPHQQQPSSSSSASASASVQHQRSFSAAATPLLDFSSLTTRSGVTPVGGGGGGGILPTGSLMSTSLHVPTSGPSTVSAYDYHAAQLERFLEEYRNLQDQLCKMKETCETIRKKEGVTPLRGVAQLADPVMFNAAMTASPTAGAKTATLKTKPVLPGQPPDPPPYWLHRNAMLKRLNDASQPTDIFKS